MAMALMRAMLVWTGPRGHCRKSPDTFCATMRRLPLHVLCGWCVGIGCLADHSTMGQMLRVAIDRFQAIGWTVQKAS